MEYSSECVALTKQFEGLRLQAYKDIAGFWTIGYGHKLTASCLYITAAEAEAILKQDLDTACKAVCRYVTTALTQGQTDALTDFVFNLGAESLRTSTLLKLVNARDFAGAAEQLLKWDHAGGVEVAGLERRRQAEHALFLKA